MASALSLLVLLVKLSMLRGEEELVAVDHPEYHRYSKGGSSYSFGYGVSGAHTGDVKTVWESKEGDTVKGHYGILEPDGSVRTLEYAAGPGKGFTTAESSPQNIKDKSYKDYRKPYELSEDAALEFYSSSERKRKKRPYDSFYKDYPMIKGTTYGTDPESSDFPYIPNMKGYRDEIDYDSEPHSHIGFLHDPNCKNKHIKDGSNIYKTTEDLDFRKHKYPYLYSDPHNYDKYSDSSNDDTDKYAQRYKLKGQQYSPIPDEIGVPTSIRYSYPLIPDIPIAENIYQDDIMQPPKKKFRPYKNTEVYYSTDDLSDYVLVPKKKLKKPPRVPNISDYPPDVDEDYDHPDEDDDRNHKPPRGSGQKEVVRKIVKKKKPSIINLLDILDI